MKLEIKVKTVKEETRDTSLAERCMNSIACNTDYADLYRKEVNGRLDEIGFVKCVNGGNTGLFRKEITWDATPEEVVAWNVVNIDDTCRGGELLCVKCPINTFEEKDYAPCKIDTRVEKARELLSGKEIILEVW